MGNFEAMLRSSVGLMALVVEEVVAPQVQFQTAVAMEIWMGLLVQPAMASRVVASQETMELLVQSAALLRRNLVLWGMVHLALLRRLGQVAAALQKLGLVARGTKTIMEAAVQKAAVLSDKALQPAVAVQVVHLLRTATGPRVPTELVARVPEVD